MGKIKMKIFLSVLTLAAVFAVADVDEAAPNTSQEEVSEASPSQQDSVLDLNQEESKCIPPDIYPCDFPDDNVMSVRKLYNITIPHLNQEWKRNPGKGCDFSYTFSVDGEKYGKESYECAATASARGNEVIHIKWKSNFGGFERKDSIIIKRTIKNGLMDGLSKIYADRGDIQGNLLQVIPYKNGLRNGQASTYDENGNKEREEEYQNNEIVFKTDYVTPYTEDSISKVCNNFSRGLMSIAFDYEKIEKTCDCWNKYKNETFFENQTLYKNGMIHSEKFFYKPCDNHKYAGLIDTNAIALIANYKNGKLNGVVKMFWPNGKIEKTIPYENGELDGTVKEFYPNGKIKSTVTYEDGEAVSEKKCFSKNGKVQKTGTENMKCD